MNKAMILKVLKKTGLTLLFPTFMFLVMWLITAINGVDYMFLTTIMVRNVASSASLTTIIALAIYLQFKNGRFDFSGGATMLLAGILAGNLSVALNENPVVFMLLAVLFSVLLSMLTATTYIVTRVPIIICTIAITLFYESITYLVYNAQGLNVISKINFVVFGRVPYIFIPLLVALVLYVVYSLFTTEGRRSKLLAGNQKVASNIGINEKKSVYVIYVFAGILLGLGALVYGSRNVIGPQANLSTSGILFSYIVPVFIGMFIGFASIDAIGIVVASVGMELLNYGMNCLGVGAGGWQQIIFGCFMLTFYAISGQLGNIKKLANALKAKTNKKRETTDA